MIRAKSLPREGVTGMSNGADKWRKHAAPYLRRALKQASRSWKPRHKRANMTKVKNLRKRRDTINRQIREELKK